MPNQAIKFEFSLADLVEGNADNEVKKMSLQALMLMENIAEQVHTVKSHSQAPSCFLYVTVFKIVL